jgi:hypothetical protein
MKFMMIVIPDETYATMPPGTMPDVEAIAQMARYNDELHTAGVLVSLYGLHVPAEGQRVTFPGGKPKVQDGPFAEAKELVGGFWIIDVESREKALEWACKIPPVEPFTIEIRQVEGPDDFAGLQEDNSVYNAYCSLEHPRT